MRARAYENGDIVRAGCLRGADVPYDRRGLGFAIGHDRVIGRASDRRERKIDGGGLGMWADPRLECQPRTVVEGDRPLVVGRVLLSHTASGRPALVAGALDDVRHLGEHGAALGAGSLHRPTVSTG